MRTNSSLKFTSLYDSVYQNIKTLLNSKQECDTVLATLSTSRNLYTGSTCTENLNESQRKLKLTPFAWFKSHYYYSSKNIERVKTHTSYRNKQGRLTRLIYQLTNKKTRTYFLPEYSV